MIVLTIHCYFSFIALVFCININSQNLRHRRRNQGGKGGWSPPKVLVYYYTILCYNVLLHGWCPPIETDLPTLL